MSQASSRSGPAAGDTQVVNAEESSMSQASSRSGPAAEDTQVVDNETVRELFRVGAGAAGEGGTTQELFGTGYVYRHDWGNRNGQHILNLNWNLITANSLVFVAIGEGAPGEGKFIGNARYTLHNVAPHNGRVTIWVNIEWSAPIRLYVDYLVINP